MRIKGFIYKLIPKFEENKYNYIIRFLGYELVIKKGN